MKSACSTASNAAIVPAARVLRTTRLIRCDFQMRGDTRTLSPRNRASRSAAYMSMSPACDDVRFLPTFAKEESPKASRAPFKLSIGQKVNSMLSAFASRTTLLKASKSFTERSVSCARVWLSTRRNARSIREDRTNHASFPLPD